MWTTTAAIVSALVGVAGLFVTWLKLREAALRREDVLTWSNEVIRALESLFLVCEHKDRLLNAEISNKKIMEIMFDTAILVERGRLLFKNRFTDKYDVEEELAYRGYRPKILDQIVVAHKIACKWVEADEDTRLRMRLIAQDCLKKFVSLAQQEVGRSRTASAEAGEGGVEVDLDHLLRNVDERRLAKLKLIQP